MTDIDWSKAPEGATHYNSAEGADWYKRHEGRWFYYDVDTRKWERSICIASGVDYTELTPRPTEQPTWSGEGSPPIGTEVEYLTLELKAEGFTEYLKGRILAYHEGHVWMLECHDGLPCSFDISELEFRPIKSERDQQIDALLSIFQTLPYFVFSRDIAADLYDKGVRVGI